MSLIHRIGSILVTITVITVGVIGSTSVGATAKAVPEFIDLTDDDVRGESGQALAAAQDAFRNTFTDGEFERALEHAKSMVTLTSELFGPQSVEVSQSLTNLGLAQAEAGDLEAARLNFESALRIREQAERSLVSPGLINPLRGMASVSVDMAELETALVLYERVIHVSHVTDGPTNLEQVDDMDALSRIHYDLENIREANRIQGKIYRLKQRKLAGNADAYIDALDDYAQWFSDTGNLSEAAFKYRLLERAIVDAHGPDSVRLIPTLIELAFIYSQSTDPMVQSQSQLGAKESRRLINRAVRIARVNSDDFPQLLPRTLVRRSDFLMTDTAFRSAGSGYREAYQLLSDKPEDLELRDEIFKKPYLVARPDIRSTYHRNERETERTNPDRGFVEISYNVSLVGRPIAVRVTNSQPAGLFDTFVARQLRRFLFRPKIENGEPVVRRGLTFRHEFRYNQSELTDSEKKRIARTEASRQKRRADNTVDEVPAEKQTTVTDESNTDESNNE